VNFVRESRCFLRPIFADFFEIFFSSRGGLVNHLVFSSKEEEKILMLSSVVSIILSNMLRAWSEFR